MGFIDPVFSSGVTVATETAIRAADSIAAELAGEDVDWQADYAAPVWEGYEVFQQCVEAWYDGTLRDLIFSNRGTPRVREQITAILAGRVWDDDNPMTRRTRERIRVFWDALQGERSG